MFDLTAFQRDILHIINGMDEPHGLAVKEKLEEYYENEINHGRLYPNLDTLVEKGLLSKGTIDKRTNSYTITSRSENELEQRMEWINSHSDSDESEDE